jgi:hypothetical protein
VASKPEIAAARMEMYACATDLEMLAPFRDSEEPGAEVVRALWDKLWLRFVAACRMLDRAIDPGEAPPPLDAQ